MSSTHHILLLGGTGVCGQVFTRAALESGHRLTLYARSPSKLPSDLAEHSNIDLIQGTYENIDGLSRAAKCGADVFVSLAGPTLGKREGTPVTEALRHLYPLLLEANPQIHILALSTPSYSARQDRRSIKWLFAIEGYVKVIGGDSYKEIKGIAEATIDLGDSVAWTVFRVPLLHGTEWIPDNKNDDADQLAQSAKSRKADHRVNSTFVGEAGDGLWLDRGRLAKWVLGELEERKWLRLCPLLSDA